MSDSAQRVGLRENLAQFSLLLLVNAFVGAMVGMERSILPSIGEQDFHLAHRTAILSFIAVFGATKAITNYWAGRLSDRHGRRIVLIYGWIVACPVPFLLMWAPDWNWILFANGLLGISQGLTWSTTVIMKIDLVGPRQRGLAMGLNECSGYLAVALSALATGWLAASYGLRPEPFVPGVIYVLAGLLLSILLIQETRQLASPLLSGGITPNSKALFMMTSWRDRNLSSVCQVGLVNNLNDGVAWGLFPLMFAAAGMRLSQVGLLAAIYPGVWGLSQIVTGALSDHIGRKWLIAAGMWLQAIGITVTAYSGSFGGFSIGAIFLGLGTAMVYPTLLAAIGDSAQGSWRATAVGIYRLWRDFGYTVGALAAGVAADFIGIRAAILIVAAITALSGAVAALRMRDVRVAA